MTTLLPTSARENAWTRTWSTSGCSGARNLESAGGLVANDHRGDER